MTGVHPGASCHLHLLFLIKQALIVLTYCRSGLSTVSVFLSLLEVNEKNKTTAEYFLLKSVVISVLGSVLLHLM